MKVEVITFDADPDHGGFGTRVHGLVRMLSRFCDVRVVLTDWFGGPRVPGVEYEELPLKDTAGSRLRRLRTYYKTDFPDRTARDGPDVAIVESLDLLGLHQYGEGVPLILDEHNIYWELLRYEIYNSPFFKTWFGRRRLVQGWLAPRLLARARAFEVDAIRRAARTLVTSESDRSVLLAAVPEVEDRVRVLPNCVDLDRFPSGGSPPETNDVVFVGTYSYVPNRDAAVFVSQALAPEIPSARFVLVGKDAPEAARGPNVVRTGYVADLQQVLDRAAICIAPLTQGSGTRLKVLTYLAAGKPVVATSKACDGLEVVDGVHVIIRDDREGMVAAIRELLEDPDRRRELGEAGRDLVRAKYDWRAHVGRLKEFISEVRLSA